MKFCIVACLALFQLTTALGFVIPWREEARFQRLLRERRFDDIEARIIAMDRELKDPFLREYLDDAIQGMINDPDDATRAINQWCSMRPASFVAFTAKGYLCTAIAWRHRGCEYARDVPEENMRRFHQYLLYAETALTNAYALNPDFPLAATEMITVSMGRCRPRSEMEQWFNRAIQTKKAGPRTYGCKELYLQPKWLGSVEEVLSFCYEIDRPETPPLITAITYGDTWHDMPQREVALLGNHEYLMRTALAYDRSSLRYFWRRRQHLFCAFFAERAHNYPLAVKHLNWISWRDGDDELPLWENKAAFLADRANAFRQTPRAIDLRFVLFGVLGLTTLLFYIPVFVCAYRENRPWRDSLIIGASLVFLATRADYWQPGLGTLSFVVAHAFIAWRIHCERTHRAVS